MTTKTIGHFVIAAVLVGSAVAGLRVTDTHLEPGSESLLADETEAVPPGATLFSVLPLSSDRLSASCAGLKVAPPPIVCLTP